MAKKKMADWMDYLGSSGLPDDELHFQTGNNFGLDAFQFDVPDNQGPEDGGRLPTTRGMAGLPDGTIPMERDAEFSFVDLTNDSADGLGMDFTAMMSEEEGNFDKMASLTDLAWLDPTQDPDLNRLPNNEKTLNSIPSLEEAWGKGRSSNGIALVPNRDKEAAQYEASLDAEVETDHTPEEIKFAIQRALRRAHYGEPINSIQAELVATLGHEASRAASAMRIIRDEHGLIGRVFVRASAFPGIKNGKWVDKIKVKNGNARYVITDDPAIAVKLGMRQVTEVPWAKALAFYAPRLTAAGYRVASEGDPKEALRRAFRIGPVAVPVRDSHKPVDKPVIASAEEAQAAMEAPRPIAPYVMTAEDHAVAAKRKVALVQMARWVKSNKLSQHDALKIRESGVDATDMLHTATAIMTATQGTPVYDGLGAQLPKEAYVQRRQAFASLAEKAAAVESSLMKRAKDQLIQMVRAGGMTPDEAKQVVRKHAVAADLLRAVTAIRMAAKAPVVATVDTVVYDGLGAQLPKNAQVTRTGTFTVKVDKTPDVDAALLLREAKLQLAQVVKDRKLSVPEAQRVAKMSHTAGDLRKNMAVAIQAAEDYRNRRPEPTKVAKYQGVIQKEAIPDRVASGVMTGEIDGYLKWARQKMAEGEMGNDLTTFIKARFALPLRKAAREQMKELRATHEGLSGHLYVDAEAYASKTGTTGCEEGALKHRTNGIKHVLAMSRCATCVFANADGVCQQYNKKLASKPPVKDHKAYQVEALRLANAHDSEVTASMFHSNEFNLRNESLEEVHMANDQTPEELGEVLFGGMEV